MYNLHLEFFFDKLVLRGGKVKKANVKSRIQNYKNAKKWPPCFNRATFFRTLSSHLCFAFSMEIKVMFMTSGSNIFSAIDLGLVSQNWWFMLVRALLVESYCILM